MKKEHISKRKALELFKNGILDKLDARKFFALKAIYKYFFDEIYDFAEELRAVNIAKGGFRFALFMYLEAALENIDKMPQLTFDEIVEKCVEMNIVHPFREINGHSTRIWLDLILKKAFGMVEDWAKSIKKITFSLWNAASSRISSSSTF